MSGMASSLLALPTETIELIATFLEAPSLLALRLVCRDLNEKTAYHYGQVSFATVRTDLSPKSLQKIFSIADHPSFNKNVKTLLFERSPSGGDFGHGLDWSRHSTGRLDPPLPFALKPLEEILLTKFVGCRSFRIQSVYGVEEPPSVNRLMPTDVVSICLAIIAAISIPIKSFIIDFVSHHVGRLDPNRLQPSPSYEKIDFLRGWENLRELCLGYSMHHADTSAWAMGFVLHAKNLTKLHLEFQDDHAETFIQHLASSTRLPPLQELKLCAMRLEKDVLMRLLSRLSESLVRLSLHCMFLMAGPTWTEVLQSLHPALPLLCGISLERLAWMTDGADGGIFYGHFESLSEDTPVPLSAHNFGVTRKKRDGTWSVMGIDYEGPQMNAALKIMGDALTGTEL